MRRDHIEPVRGALNTPATHDGECLRCSCGCCAMRAVQRPRIADLLPPHQPGRTAPRAGARLAARTRCAAEVDACRSTPGRRRPGASMERVRCGGARHAARRTARPDRDDRPSWSACAAALRYEPIVTVCDTGGRHAPARSHDDRAAGRVAGAGAVRLRPRAAQRPRGFRFFVIGGAQPGSMPAAKPQGHAAAGARGTRPAAARRDSRVRQLITEKRATFRCVPGLQRPPATSRLRSPPAINRGFPTRPRSEGACAAPLRQWHRCVESSFPDRSARFRHTKILLG